jgi:hypothetical protein
LSEDRVADVLSMTHSSHRILFDRMSPSISNVRLFSTVRRACVAFFPDDCDCYSAAFALLPLLSRVRAVLST